jgi:hypothetical protein
MKWHSKISNRCLLALTLLVGGGAARAQDTPQEGSGEKPKPAARSYPVPIVDTGNPQDENGVTDTTNGLQPDTTPLTGVQNPTLGNPEINHNYFVPGIQYSGQVQSSPANPTETSNWFVNNFIIGNLSLLKSWDRSQLGINYSGGGYFTNQKGQGGGGYYQQLNASQAFQWERWHLLFLNQFSYLPEMQFGFGGGTNLGIPGVSGSLGAPIPGLGGSYVPNQSVYSAIGPRYSNAAVVQATYQVSPRGSFTASGSYGLLTFVDPGNINSTAAGGTFGYNFAIDRHNTLGVVYQFSGIHYQGEPQAFGDHVASFAYGRKITGRLALQVFAGPSYTTFRVPVNGNTSQLGANISANLNLGFQNGGIIAGFIHALTAGGGVLTGSTVNQLNFGLTRKLGRVWSGTANMGYAHNRAVASVVQNNGQDLSTVFVGGGLNRPIGRNATFTISYQATFNSYNQAACVGTACSPSQTIQYITFNVQWHTRPFVLP